MLYILHAYLVMPLVFYKNVCTFVFVLATRPVETCENIEGGILFSTIKLKVFLFFWFFFGSERASKCDFFVVDNCVAEEKKSLIKADENMTFQNKR